LSYGEKEDAADAKPVSRGVYVTRKLTLAALGTVGTANVGGG